MHQARQREEAPRRTMAFAGANSRTDESHWRRRSRVFFLLGAAVACWAVPLVVVYWLA